MMTMKTNKDGTMSISYDTACNYVTTSSISTLQSTIEELTKKPEVRKDQRSKIDVSYRGVYAKYYEDGFFKNEKFLIPEIKSVEVFHSNTVKITFKNNDVQTTTVQSGDEFSLENGILWCLVKEMIGTEGTAIINKLVSYATKIHFDSLKAQADTLKAEKDATEAKQKKDKKFQKYIEKKKAKERENRIQEMAEAIVRAKEIEKR